MSKKRHRQAHPPAYWQMSRRQWLSFPVLFAFALGIFVMGLMPTPADLVLFFAALVMLGYGLGHVATGFLARRRAQQQAISGPPRARPTRRGGAG